MLPGLDKKNDVSDNANRLDIDRLASLGGMVSEFVHEMNNLVGGIRAYAELEVAERPADANGNLKKIIDGCRWAGSLAQAILEFSRMPDKDIPGSVDDAIAGVLGLFSYRIQNAVRMRYSCDIGGATPPVALSTVQLQIVMANLIKNALDATRELNNPEIHIHSEVMPHAVTVTVWNSGPTISDTTMGRMFTPFFTTKSGADGGTGLGLPIARRLLRQGGGDISVANVADGVAFKVVVPLAKPQIDVSKPVLSRQSYNLAGCRVLIVDDDESIRRALQLVMTMVGKAQAADTCSSGEEALRLLEHQSFDALLLDLRMPGCSGQETFERLAEPMRHRVVFLTGDIDPAAADFMAQSRQPFLYKPFNNHELLSAVKSVAATDRN